MTPTRPLDGSPKTPAELGARRAGRVSGKGRAPSAPEKTGGASPTSVAESLAGTRQLADAGRSEVSRLDQEQLSAIKEAIQNGSFTIDYDAVADRLLSDSLGSE